jgi:predicted RND superfamily exporter protein
MMSIFVCVSVLLTLVEVGGLMHVSGLTINSVSATFLILAVGLSVDYSAHIAHTFMVSPGGYLLVCAVFHLYISPST